VSLEAANDAIRAASKITYKKNSSTSTIVV